ncbi:unnamed protein product, partial [Prorocentrum cordatum]
MGPTLLCPGTHSAEWHTTLERTAPSARAGDAVLDSFGAAAVACEAGTAVLMDSRLLHCGGRNAAEGEGGRRRRLLVATWQLPGNAPVGSTYSIRGELAGRLRLRHFLEGGAGPPEDLLACGAGCLGDGADRGFGNAA